MEDSVCIKEKDFEKIPPKSNESNNPLIKGFLEDEKNRRLYKRAICDFTEENKRKVEEEFSLYYEYIRKTAYYSNMIRFIAIDFDKKMRKLNNRFLLTLDQPLQLEDSEGSSIKDMIVDPAAQYFYEGGETLKSQISDKRLYKAIENLTKKQALVIELIYVKNLSNKEIADIIQTTPQNISNIHRKALQKLKTQMDGDR